MAAEARRRGLPPELPVMASLVESGVRNLDGGDRDSVGFFQMRTGIWNRGAYAGYPDRPELQLRWFLDQAEAVRKQRGATTDPQQYGEWIADVERPAEQYRGRYQLQLDRARELLEQSGGGDRPRHAAAADVLDVVGAGGGLRSSPRALEAIEEAKEHLGTPYQWGGSSPSTGFDCSGLIQYAYAKAGVRIPRTTYTQFDAPNAQHIDRKHLLPGDVVFFRSASGDVHHEGLYLGDGKFLHAPHTGDVVKVSRLSEPYFAREFAGGRRFARAGQAAVRAASAGHAGAPHLSDASVRAALAAIQRDADEAAQPGTQLYKAVRDQELLKERVLAEEGED
jgi:cell wall-associated NlpC family hydrolase